MLTWRIGMSAFEKSQLKPRGGNVFNESLRSEQIRSIGSWNVHAADASYAEQYQNAGRNDQRRYTGSFERRLEAALECVRRTRSEEGNADRYCVEYWNRRIDG